MHGAIIEFPAVFENLNELFVKNIKTSFMCPSKSIVKCSDPFQDNISFDLPCTPAHELELHNTPQKKSFALEMVVKSNF